MTAASGAILVVAGSPALARLGSAERWAFELLRPAVDHVDTLVTTDAGGPSAWALTVARVAGRRWAVYGLDGFVRREHGGPARWGTPDPADEKNRATFAAWCLHRDRVMGADAARAAARGRSVRVLVLVAPSTESASAFIVARARAAGLPVDLRRFGE